MDDDVKAVQQAAYDFERHHDETLVAILVAGRRAEIAGDPAADWAKPEMVVAGALADLAEIRRQLKGDG